MCCNTGWGGYLQSSHKHASIKAMYDENRSNWSKGLESFVRLLLLLPLLLPPAQLSLPANQLPHFKSLNKVCCCHPRAGAWITLLPCSPLLAPLHPCPPSSLSPRQTAGDLNLVFQVPLLPLSPPNIKSRTQTWVHHPHVHLILPQAPLLA